MSEYLGYRVIIDGITIPETMIVKRSFGTTPQERLAGSWVDANLISHDEVNDNPKVVVAFTLRKRTLSDHETYTELFEDFNNKMVTYWDDRSCTYKTGRFKMARPNFVSYVEGNELYYDPTQIQLTEY